MYLVCGLSLDYGNRTRKEMMKFQAVLSKTTTDMIKSKMLSPQVTQVVLDVYMSPEQWAEFVNKFYDVGFEVEVKAV